MSGCSHCLVGSRPQPGCLPILNKSLRAGCRREGEDDEEGNMDEWDQEKLEQVGLGFRGLGLGAMHGHREQTPCQPCWLGGVVVLLCARSRCVGRTGCMGACERRDLCCRWSNKSTARRSPPTRPTSSASTSWRPWRRSSTAGALCWHRTLSACLWVACAAATTWSGWERHHSSKWWQQQQGASRRTAAPADVHSRQGCTVAGWCRQAGAGRLAGIRRMPSSQPRAGQGLRGTRCLWSQAHAALLPAPSILAASP